MSEAVLGQAENKQLAVASQWQLVWWAFKRHHLAMVGLYITAFLYLIALAPGFFATNNPSAQNGRAAYHPPQSLHFIDTLADGGWTFKPYIHASVLKRDPQTLAAIFTEDTSKKIYLQFLGSGYE